VSVSDAALGRLRDALQDAGGRYEVGEEIGRGGMGAVHRARDLELGRDVALKTLDDAAPEGAEERLRREAEILARLEHPGIVPVHDVGTLADGRLFYAMKLVNGERLDAFAARSDADERLRAFERVCETVAFAHARGVLHRDLKPANVMVGEFGEVLVMDWGVAKVLADPAPEARGSPSADGHATAHGTVLGTRGYMAPEQERGETDLDARADVHALGRILAELFADGRAPASRRRAIDAVAARASAPSREERYPDAAALGADVARLRAGLAVSAAKESVLQRAARLLSRHRTAAILVATYLVVRALLILLAGR